MFPGRKNRSFQRKHAEDVVPAIKYFTFVIPAKAGIQFHYWMPDQVRHDGCSVFICRVNIILHGSHHISDRVSNKRGKAVSSQSALTGQPGTEGWIQIKGLTGQDHGIFPVDGDGQPIPGCRASVLGQTQGQGKL
jgi:hypothetical protein